MAVNLTVNGTTFAYPENGEEPGWGESATAWAEEVTTVLASVLGTNDIVQTSFNIANNVGAATNITGLVFNTAAVRAAIIEYSLYRVTDSNEVAESGLLNVVYKTNAAVWELSQISVGDSQVTFSVTNTGQFQYTSTNLAGTNYSGLMKFRARTVLTS